MGRPIRNVGTISNMGQLLPDYSEGVQIKTDDTDPRFNNALARGLAILRAYQIDQTLLGNVEIANITKLPKPTVSRLTFTLTQLGYLRYREEFGKYELAAGVVGLAYPYIATRALPSIARPLMVELAMQIRTNIGLGVHENLSVLYLEYALGERNPNRRQRVGFRVPLIRTAMGRACIAAMESRERERLYAQLSEHYPSEWADLRLQLDDAVAQIEVNGYCIAAHTFQRGTISVAVPFLDSDGRTVMAFNSQGSATTQTPAILAKNGKRLLDMAEKVRARLVTTPTTPSLG